MEAYPRTQSDFEDWFASEAACVEYLRRVRWPKGFRCGRCESDQGWLTRRGLWRCRRCDAQTSVTAGTLFEGTRKPLRLWFRAMWHATERPHGASACEIQRILKLGSYHTAWVWMHKLRRAMAGPGEDLLAGTVAVDQAWLDGAKPGPTAYARSDRPLIFVAAEDSGGWLGRLRLCRVPDRTAGSLQAAIRRTVALGAMIHTDDCPAYQGLRLYGYRHRVVQSDVMEVHEHPLPLVAEAMGLLRQWLLATPRGAVGPPHLDYYLDEFAFRFNHRRLRSHGKLFHRLLCRAVAVGPVPIGQIVRRRPR